MNQPKAQLLAEQYAMFNLVSQWKKLWVWPLTLLKMKSGSKWKAKYVFVYVQNYSTKYNWYFTCWTFNEHKINSKHNMIKPEAQLSKNIFFPNVARQFKKGDEV